VSSWKVDRLEVYRGLGVREVWVWRKDKLTLHRLGRSIAARDRPNTGRHSSIVIASSNPAFCSMRT
jgi:hypothetical protein